MKSVIELARESFAFDEYDFQNIPRLEGGLTRFAALVRQDQKERDAALAEKYYNGLGPCHYLAQAILKGEE